MEVVKGPDNNPEQRISKLIHVYEKELLRLCCVCLRDTQLAEDAVQETFLKAYKSLHAFRGESSEKTWLIRIAINVCRDMQRTSWLRNVGRMVRLEDVQLAQAQEWEERSAIVDAIMRLPAKLREVVLLYYYEEMSMQDVAHAVGVSMTTVHRRLGKARARLKNMLEGGDDLEAR